MARVLLSAFGIHAGGGRVLLEALVRELRPHLKAAALDARVRDRLEIGAAPVDFVARTLRARLRSLQALARRAAPGDLVFCFNGLPPLRKPGGVRVILYMQGRHLLVSDPQVRYPLQTALRVAVERLWLRIGIRQCDEMWVQTPAMADLARRVFPALEVRILPFADADLAARLQPSAALPAVPAPREASFFYPADGVAHKNHAVLLRAWALLARQDCRPLLYLTLAPSDYARVLAEAGMTGQVAPEIINLGALDRQAVLQRLAGSSALLFASSLESFGLPLLEARALGAPILAAERDFVRDVCVPRETFDPASPRSIADAVLRFLGAGPGPGLRVLSPREFVQVLAG